MVNKNKKKDKNKSTMRKIVRNNITHYPLKENKNTKRKNQNKDKTKNNRIKFKMENQRNMMKLMQSNSLKVVNSK